MKKLVPVILGLLATVGSHGSTAEAGVKHTVVVSYSESGGVAYVRGALGSARNSSNNVERIGCTAWRYSGALGGAYMSCEARTAAGTIRGCNSSDPVMVEGAENLSDNSLVEFWVQNGDCIHLSSEIASNLAPKVN